MIKRLTDILISLIGLIILSPVFLIVALCIVFTSGFPVFFKQTRVGKGEVHFKIFKFRTMKISSQSGSLVTQNQDKRITAFGKILRATKLDEFPQLINVLIGNMSIVGPRPEIPELVAFYTPDQRRLLSVKPGITSPAAIYHRDEEDIIGTSDEVFEYHRKVLVPKKAAFDLAYISKASFLFDIKIILLTLVSVVTNQSGYMREHALRQRRLLVFFLHIFLSGFAFYLAFLFRFDGYLPHLEWARFLKTVSAVILVKLTFLSFFGLTRGYWRYVGIKDVTSIAKAIFLSTITLFILEFLFLDQSFPSGVVIIDSMLSFVIFSSFRFSTRFLREAYYPLMPKNEDKVLILGASDRGETFLRDLMRNPEIAYDIKGFIDLDPNKTGIIIHGIKVLGTINSLGGIMRQLPINTIINTYPTLSRNNTIQLSKIAARFGASIKTLPPFSEVITGGVSKNKLRDLKFEDLLGREQVNLDQDLLNLIYKGKKVLVTGAGGSIGSELVRQIITFSPKELYLLDKDETLLYEIQTELKEINCPISFKTLIGDIRNKQRIEFYFNKYKPEIVLHSAAYKHVPLMEEHPQEALQNNVYGTRNLLKIADKFSVQRFVIISTDKAVKPTNVMGATKAMAERIMFEEIAPSSKMKCMAVRFGNVLGSRGSVIPLFKRQIERGGPLHITHKDIMRFFMSIPEATQLVLQAGAMGNGSEIFILKMGDPVKIYDLAHQMIQHAGLIPNIDINIEYTGLRPGEKMYEELLTDLENSTTTTHEKIYIAPFNSASGALDIQKIDNMESRIFTCSNREIREFLITFVKSYVPNLPVE